MFSLSKHVLSEYMPLLVKMGHDLHTFALAKDNFEALVDVEVLLAFHYLVPMLEIVNRVIKWVKIEMFTLWILFRE